MTRLFKSSWVGVRLLTIFALLTLGTLTAPMALAKTPASALSQAGSTVASTIALADLPKQGRDTYALILAGGPFPYEKDGSVFGNRERILPAQKRGYYREYTVATPNARTRGAKRIVCGGGPVTSPQVCYYTDDHYASFKRIAP